MKLILKNSNIIFQKNNLITKVIKCGNNTSGVTLNSYMNRNGKAAIVQGEYNHATSPLINISNIASDIILHNILKPYDGQIISFFSDNDENTFISCIDSSVNTTEYTISKEDIPINAKYIRFTALNGSILSEDDEAVTTITFKVIAG